MVRNLIIKLVIQYLEKRFYRKDFEPYKWNGSKSLSIRDTKSGIYLDFPFLLGRWNRRALRHIKERDAGLTPCKCCGDPALNGKYCAPCQIIYDDIVIAIKNKDDEYEKHRNNSRPTTSYK